jgi:hypothetical protein
VPVFLYAAETLIDFSHALLSVERMRRRPKASCHHLRKVDFRQVANATGQKLLDLKVRPLFVDTRLKEYTTGIPQELTDRQFLVRRALRVNDALPTESASAKPRAGNGNAAAGCSSTVSPDESPSSTCPSSIPSIRPQAGIATTSPTCGVSEDGKKLYASSLR